MLAENNNPQQYNSLNTNVKMLRFRVENFSFIFLGDCFAAAIVLLSFRAGIGPFSILFFVGSLHNKQQWGRLHIYTQNMRNKTALSKKYTTDSLLRIMC